MNSYIFCSIKSTCDLNIEPSIEQLYVGYMLRDAAFVMLLSVYRGCMPQSVEHSIFKHFSRNHDTVFAARSREMNVLRIHCIESACLLFLMCLFTSRTLRIFHALCFALFCLKFNFQFAVVIVTIEPLSFK